MDCKNFMFPDEKNTGLVTTVAGNYDDRRDADWIQTTGECTRFPEFFSNHETLFFTRGHGFSPVKIC
jgi:hypothetical protein